MTTHTLPKPFTAADGMRAAIYGCAAVSAAVVSVVATAAVASAARNPRATHDA